MSRVALLDRRRQLACETLTFLDAPCRACKFSKRNEGRPGLDTDGSDDEVRPKESDPIQPCSFWK